MLSEINASSQCLFPEMCGTHEVHPGEVNPPSIYQGPLVRVRDLSGAFCIFSNTTITLSCQASLWSAEGIPARLSTGWSRKHPPNAFCLGRILFPQTTDAMCAALLITPFVKLWFCFPQRRTYFIEHLSRMRTQGTKSCLERCFTPLWMYSQSFLLSPLLFIWQKCLELKTNLMAQQKETRSSLERLKTLIRLIQNEQMIQVTMTTTTTTSLLSIPWIKPSAASVAMHKALQPSQGNNWQESAVWGLRKGRQETLCTWAEERWNWNKWQKGQSQFWYACRAVSPVCRSLWQQVPTEWVVLRFHICQDLQRLWHFVLLCWP